LSDPSDQRQPAAPAPLIPGWTVWQSPVNRLWHARKNGTRPPVIVHGNTLAELREQVRYQ